jgi:predicted nucleotidyltransferase
MSVSAPPLDAVVESYVADVLDALEDAGVSVPAAFLVGSVATGDFDPATSDIDLVAVVDRPLASEDRKRLAEAISRLGCPARALELVAYVRGNQPPEFELNVNADAAGAREAEAPAHWFVIDAALAQERAVPFGDDGGWADYFEPVPEERLREALVQSIAWSEAQPVDDEFARLNAIRARHYLETGQWLAKKDAA